MRLRILDSDVLIDLLRGHSGALAWLGSLAVPPSVAGLAVMEVIQGCRNNAEVAAVQRLVRPMPVVWPAVLDCQRALADFTRYFASHRLGLLDSLIATTAIGANATVCTFNVKHFRVVRGLTTEQPYKR